jgi:purine-cytosine permease-like protein
MTDPVAGLKPLLPGWLFLLFVLLVIAGSIANNAPTFYSSGLCLQAAGLRLSRLGATILDIGISGAAVLYIMFLQDLTTVLNNFVSLLVAWSGPYAGVWLCDGILRRWRFDLEDIHPTRPRAGGFGRKAAWAAYFVGMAVAVVTMKCPLFQGPVNKLLNGMDLSWALGLLVSAATYALLAGRPAPAFAPQDARPTADDPAAQVNNGAVS